MPKNTKKPKKKAVSRAVLAKPRRSGSAAKAKQKAPKRSVARPSARKAKVAATKELPRVKAKAKAKAGPKAKAKPAPLRQKAKPPRAQAKAPVKRKVKAQARTQPARTVILPPKPHRKTGRIAPPPPRTPRVITALVDQGLKLDQPVVSTALRANATVVPLRAPGARQRVTADSWRRIEESAARQQRGELTAQQRIAIRAALEGQDTLVVVPDDAHAVACYQLASGLLEAPTVVLSPVLAELQAQSEALTAQRRAVVFLLPELSGPERSAALARIARGGSLLVLLSPEALIAADARKALAKSGISLFVVEEAHCASDLAHEIRPSYGELGIALRAFGKPPVMALTRGATSQVLRDIAVRLELRDPIIVQAPAVPANLQVVTRLARGEQRQAALVRLVERLEPPGLIFCASPHDVDSVYSALRGSSSRITTHRYHSGMTPGDRAAELLNFTLPGARGVMVAVSAFAPGSGLPGLGEQASATATGFGRGAGKRDLRFVVHYQSPASIEQYLREIQRAGQDGLAATCVLFHESSHRSLHEVMLAQQRFRATHLAELGRALEAHALEGRTVTLESLALATGQSRRTTDRLAALLADAGAVSKTGGWVSVSSSAAELAEACRSLGAKLYALREQDGHRLSAVGTFAETNDCKLGYLSRYLGQATPEPCGHCSACKSELSSTESIPPQAAARRPMVQEFSVYVPAEPRAAESAVLASNTAPLTAKLADFGAAMPRAGH